jgi:hypothetical protein
MFFLEVSVVEEFCVTEERPGYFFRARNKTKEAGRVLCLVASFLGSLLL